MKCCECKRDATAGNTIGGQFVCDECILHEAAFVLMARELKSERDDAFTAMVVAAQGAFFHHINDDQKRLGIEPGTSRRSS